MTRSPRTALAALLISTALAQNTALAQKTAPLKLVLTQALVQITVRGAKSTEKLLPQPAGVVPGAVLEQAVTAINTLDKPLGNVTVNLPVPAGTRYLAALGNAGVTTVFSFDQGKTFGAAPLYRTVTVTENGKAVQKQLEVSPAEYTNVRWTVPQFAAQGSLKLGFRVRVN
jgi:hypothetical protein